MKRFQRVHVRRTVTIVDPQHDEKHHIAATMFQLLLIQHELDQLVVVQNPIQHQSIQHPVDLKVLDKFQFCFHKHSMKIEKQK